MPGVGNGLLEHWTFSAPTSNMETDTNDLQVKLRCKCQQFTNLLQSCSKLWAEFREGLCIVRSNTEYQSGRWSRDLCEYRISPSNIKKQCTLSALLYLLGFGVATRNLNKFILTVKSHSIYSMSTGIFDVCRGFCCMCVNDSIRSHSKGQSQLHFTLSEQNGRNLNILKGTQFF